MALAEELNGKKVQDLINDSDFIKALVPKLAEGTGTNGIYTKKGVDDTFVKTLGLTDTIKTEVVKTDVVKALVPKLAEGTGTNGIYTKKDVDDAFVKTLDLETPTVAEKILGAKDGKKSILVEKLGGFLDNDTANNYKAKYDGANEQTAKAFLESKGLTPPIKDLADKLTQEKKFVEAVKGNIDFKDNEDFKINVRDVMSKPVFEIPTDETAPLSWDW